MSFEEFAEARLPAMLRYAALLTGDRELAKDLVQEVMIRVYGKWRRIVRVDHPERYVRKMITNEFLSLRRRKSLRTVALAAETLEGRGHSAPDHADERAERDLMWSRLATLPRQQRAVIVLRYYEGLSDSEIADVLGCAAGTVRGYASRALATLRVEMAKSPTAAAGGCAG